MRSAPAVFAALLLLIANASAVAAERAGEVIYKADCARCHGAAGGGTKKARPLAGDRSLPQLTRVIQQTMPDDDPGSLSPLEAKNVATWMYDAFYSPDAQARLHPPRVELARLTVAQYRNSVSDLIGSFRGTFKPDNRYGLRGEYFDARDFGRNRRIDRVDPEVSFDFGTDGPTKDNFNPNTFCIRWEGSVLAPETGQYEFVVKTEHALRLWVNDMRTPVIDAMVKSGNDTEYRSSIFLLAGRSYSIRLEFSKGRNLGVNSKAKPPPPTPATISLAWKRPHRADEVIDSRFLSPARAPEVAVLSTPFPPDDRSYGWERATTISREWEDAAANAAMETAGYIAAHQIELSGAQPDTNDRVKKLQAFCRTFVERAFRRPLTDAEVKQYVTAQFDAASDPDLALKRVVMLTLMSPRFLYPSLSGGSSQYMTASRLAYTLWDSPPDKALLDAAAAGKLATSEDIRRQAQRLIADPKARAKMREFMMAWLHVENTPELAKDTKRFPGFDATLANDLRTSLELFLDDIVWSDQSDFRQILLSNEFYLNGRLAKFYGVDLPADAPFQKMKLDPDKRAGVITHPYLLSVFAYTGESSPIHRGVFIIRGILGVTLRPPQEAFVPFSAERHPDLTTRERVSLQTKSEACVTCHSVINSTGFSLENFDAVGRFRDKERNKLIDASGLYETRAGPVAKFNGARELAKFLAGSEEVQGAFTQQLFQHLVKQAVRSYGLDKPKLLQKTFAESGYSVKKLMEEIAVIAAAPPPADAPVEGKRVAER